MRRVALRGLLARKTRLALTVLSVALGVTLISGTLIFTDTINSSFDAIFNAAYEKTDVVVTADDSLAINDSGDKPSVDAALLDTIKGVDGVAQVAGGVFDQGGTFLDAKGESFSGQGPKFVASAFADGRFGGFSYAEGSIPQAADEVALDKASADRAGLKVGDSMFVQGETAKKRYTVSGLVTVAGVDSYGGAAVALMTLAEAQRVTGKVGRFDEIDMSVVRGVEPDAVVERLRAALPDTVQVRTGQAEAASQTADIRDQLGFLRTALLAFAGIALFVGAFIIFNTFSITVAQRAREFALLRTLGASRGQVLRSVLAEGAVLGVLGSAAGLVLGIGVAAGLKALFKAVGFELPSSGIVIAGRTIWVSMLVGVLVTLVSTLAPALRATRVPPVAALREGVALPETRSSRLAFPLSVLLTALGLAGMAVGLFAGLGDSTALLLLGIGAAFTFLGVALLSPRLVGPIASVVGRPIERVFGVTGRLARENTVRQPGRTAVTSAALMVGVALVAFASIFAAGAKGTVEDVIDSRLLGQAVVQNTDGFSPFSSKATERVAQTEGVERVSALRFVKGRVDGSEKDITGVDPDTFTELVRLDLPPLNDKQAAISADYAEQEGLAVGDTLEVTTPTRKRVTLEIVAVLEETAQLLSDITVTNTVIARDFAQTDDSFVLVGYQGGATTKQRVDAALKADFPQAEALTSEEFKDKQAGQVNQLLGIIYALLALTVIVAMFGIVNTLVLSVTERTRELGMLRAIGTSRRQVKQMIRYEAVITAQIGGVLGIALGVLLAVLVAQPLDDFQLSFPYLTLVLTFAGASFAGVLAAVLPARRASRLDVLEALAYE